MLATNPMHIGLWLFALSVASSAGCWDEVGAADRDAPPSGPSGEDDPIVGSIQVQAKSLSARFFDAAQRRGVREGDAPLAHVEVNQIGECRLLRYEPSFCEPACAGLCVQPGTCVPFPVLVSAGTLTLRGAVELTVEQSALGDYRGYIPPGVPLVTPGQPVTIEATGSAQQAAFVVAGVGVPALESSIAGTFVSLEDDHDTVLNWVAADPESRVRAVIWSPNEAHGLPATGILECDAGDSGSLVIDRELIRRFPMADHEGPIELACSGYDCPMAQLVRYRRTAEDTDMGRLELEAIDIVTFRALHR